jgi:hypothetical protein
MILKIHSLLLYHILSFLTLNSSLSHCLPNMGNNFKTVLYRYSLSNYETYIEFEFLVRFSFKLFDLRYIITNMV